MYDQTRAQQPPDLHPDPGGRRTTGPEPLLPPEERAEIVRRLGHAVNTFADTPREALEEAEAAFDEAAARLASALSELRRVLRAGWQDRDPEADSAELRDALRQYRDLTQRLLRT
ncbi:hypothetical protein [Streptomyces fuscichromogenes]|uniref:Uncharacterized protein n=1 Tax=Streptomyces fuscichromogenes TaxID=1324013 RepID=A0A918CRS3_9ACTN|nr:hypothetical protein [Streptomyces fuscichromogenes]GGN08300.1 hypothetical protein GCM10011578_033150 [Streptomyces fuscichromogenes]